MQVDVHVIEKLLSISTYMYPSIHLEIHLLGTINFKINQFLLSKFTNLSAITMGPKTMLFCLLQFLSLFSDVVACRKAMPNNALVSYVDCSRYSDDVSLLFLPILH